MHLDFQKISRDIPFKTLLDALNIAYVQKGKYLKGKTNDFMFIANMEDNIFFDPNSDLKGSVINFYSAFNKTDLRTAAEELNKQYLTEVKAPKRELPTLELAYHPYLEAYGITRETAQKYEVGLVKSKSIFSGKIAFKYHNELGEHTGYAAFDPKDKKWHFPVNFKRTLYNAHNAEAEKLIVVPDLFDCLLLIQKGFNAVCTTGLSMTESQEEFLKKKKNIVLLHPEPDNIVLRLKSLFVKAPLLINPIRNYSVEEILSFL